MFNHLFKGFGWFWRFCGLGMFCKFGMIGGFCKPPTFGKLGIPGMFEGLKDRALFWGLFKGGWPKGFRPNPAGFPRFAGKFPGGRFPKLGSPTGSGPGSPVGPGRLGLNPPNCWGTSGGWDPNPEVGLNCLFNPVGSPRTEDGMPPDIFEEARFPIGLTPPRGKLPNPGKPEIPIWAIGFLNCCPVMKLPGLGTPALLNENFPKSKPGWVGPTRELLLGFLILCCGGLSMRFVLFLTFFLFLSSVCLI